MKRQPKEIPIKRCIQMLTTMLMGMLFIGFVAPVLASADSPLAWTNIFMKNNFMTGVSCPSVSLCVAVNSQGDVVTSTNPTGGAGAWTVTHVAAINFTAVSCPSTALCVAGDSQGDVVTSTNPTGGAGAWTVTHVDDAFSKILHAVSCPSTSLCVAGDGEGNVVTSTNPTGGVGAWTVTPVDNSFGDIYGVSCPSTTLCVAVVSSSRVITSTNPTGGAGSWSVAPVAGISFRGVSCPTTSLCVATSNAENIVTSTNPTGGVSAWTVTHVNDSGVTLGVSCPTVALCVAVNGEGDVVTSTNPTGGASAWTVTHVDEISPYLFTAVSCPSTTLCVAVGSNVIAVGGLRGPSGNSSAATPPVVKILSTPPPETANQKAVFTFEGVAGGTYECSIDDGAWAPCTSGQRWGPLPPGDHLFRVRETLAGLTGPVASYRWTIALPKACVLRIARARIFAYTTKHKVRLVIHYTSYRPADVAVSYKLIGTNGRLGLGSASEHFKRAGVFRLPESLTGGETAKVRNAKFFKVHFTIPETPSGCRRYYTKRLTIPQTISGQTVWFQSDSIFAPLRLAGQAPKVGLRNDGSAA